MPIKYSVAQQQIIDRYLEATKHCPESRIPLEKLVSMKKHVPRCRPDSTMLKKCERDFLESEQLETVGRKKRQIDNSLVASIFYKYEDYYDAKSRFYWLDDIITGVSRLDLGGNTRPLNTGVLYNFLSTASVINTTIIMDYCDVKERQAQKILLSLVVANRVIENEIRRMNLTL